MPDASRSFDPDNAIVSYRWLQIEGTPAGISDPTAVNPVFTAPDVKQKGAVLIFELAVIDDGGLQSTDICTVVVENVNLPPGLNKDKYINIK
jgi:chitinase